VLVLLLEWKASNSVDAFPHRAILVWTRSSLGSAAAETITRCLAKFPILLKYNILDRTSRYDSLPFIFFLPRSIGYG